MMIKKKVWIYSSIAAILLFSLAFCVRVIGELNINNDAYGEEIEYLEGKVNDSRILLDRERKTKLLVLDSLQKLGEAYLVLEKKDSLAQVRHKKELKALRTELSIISNTELSNLMIKTYEEATVIDN